MSLTKSLNERVASLQTSAATTCARFARWRTCAGMEWFCGLPQKAEGALQIFCGEEQIFSGAADVLHCKKCPQTERERATEHPFAFSVCALKLLNFILPFIEKYFCKCCKIFL